MVFAATVKQSSMCPFTVRTQIQHPQVTRTASLYDAIRVLPSTLNHWIPDSLLVLLACKCVYTILCCMCCDLHCLPVYYAVWGSNR